MKREKLIAKIHEYLVTRKSALRRYLSGELSNLGTDDDEESVGDEAYFVMAESEAKELELISAAIKRVDAGQYGICEHCEKEIPSARLEALPCATLCITCQRAHEQGDDSALPPTGSSGHELST